MRIKCSDTITDYNSRWAYRRSNMSNKVATMATLVKVVLIVIAVIASALSMRNGSNSSNIELNATETVATGISSSL